MIRNVHGERVFQSTPSVWRATPPRGARLPAWGFQSTPSVWRATGVLRVRVARVAISIHALRVEGDVGEALRWRHGDISIHALRVEGDTRRVLVLRVHLMSIHALRVEGDVLMAEITTPHDSFQSTPSVWRATSSPHLSCPHLKISIHALRVEGDVGPRELVHLAVISIHALRVEGDV